MESLILGFLSLNFTLMLTLFGLNTKRISEVDKRLRDAPSREEVDKTIDNKIEVVKVLQQEIKEDIKDLKDEIHRLLDKQ